VRADEVEPGSVMTFFLLLSAFIAVLALRAYLLSPSDSTPTAAAATNHSAVVVAKSVSLRTAF
jgi:hypothetical protein